MKIAYLIQGLHNSGGMERVITAKASYLAEYKGFELCIITTDGADLKPYYVLSPKVRVVSFGLNYLSDNKGSRLGRYLIYLLKQRRYKKMLKKFLLSEKFDIVISTFGTERSILPKINDSSIKIAESHFSKDFRNFNKRGGLFSLLDKYRSWQDKMIARRYAKMVVLTNEDAPKWDADNVIVIPNATSFLPTEIADLTTKRAIAVGRLTPQKGFDMLIESWEIVNQRHPDWQLDIFGSGEEFEMLTAMIQRNNLDKVITINSPVNAIDKELISSSIYLLTSRFEGLPMVMLEAMSCGVPAVCYECPSGPKDVIDSGVDGLLVENKNINKFAQGVCSVIENEEFRAKMGLMARKKIEQKFSIEPIMKQWIELFNELLK